MRVSIISLIYQSPSLADWVHASVHKYTPMIARGEAEFFFVANDPTIALVEHLEHRGYPYVLNFNERYQDEELFALGYGTPEYMSRVYRGYNEGVWAAKGDFVVLLNSDNFVSPDWLENLLKYSDRSRVISSTLVEREHPVFSVFPGAVHGEFGGTVESFDEDAFLSFVSRSKKTGLDAGGAYMPTLFHRDVAIEAGLYPCGNIAGSSFDEVVRCGDEAFFDALGALGVEHYTALDSVVYHLKEGERENVADGQSGSDLAEPADAEAARTKAHAYPQAPAIERVRDSMPPTKRHEALVSAISSDKELRERRRQLAALADADVAATALHDQAERLRAQVERALGPRLAIPAMRLIHSVSWMTRPLRRWLALRRNRRDTRVG